MFDHLHKFDIMHVESTGHGHGQDESYLWIWISCYKRLEPSDLKSVVVIVYDDN
jgi:hypothetical protein